MVSLLILMNCVWASMSRTTSPGLSSVNNFLCVHTSALSREFHISQVRALAACSVNRDQGRDLEKSKAKFGNHVVPLCDTNTLTAVGGRGETITQVSGLELHNLWTYQQIDEDQDRRIDSG